MSDQNQDAASADAQAQMLPTDAGLGGAVAQGSDVDATPAAAAPGGTGSSEERIAQIVAEVGEHPSTRGGDDLATELKRRFDAAGLDVDRQRARALAAEIEEGAGGRFHGEAR